MTSSPATIRLHPRGDDFPAIVRRVETVCPYCGVGCGLVLNLSANGEIVEVDDVPEHPSSRGMLCVKGRFGLGFVHSPDRLTAPLVRERLDEPFRETSWDEALDVVAERFAAHRGAFAALGSAKATNEDNYVIQKFTRAVMGTNTIDHCARLCHSSSVVAMMDMVGSSSTTNSYSDFEEAGCLFVAGSETDVNHPIIASRLRGAVRDLGTALVVVNPKRIALCDIADVWLRPKPGTDVALFNGLAWLILDEGLQNDEFIEARTEGYTDWHTALAPYTPVNVTALTGVSEEDMRRAARLIARPGRGGATSFLWGMGMTQHTRGVANVQALINLVLLTGQIGKPGSGLAPLRGQNNVQGCSDMGVLPETLPGYQRVDSDLRVAFEQAWGTELPATPGLKMSEMLDAALSGVLRAMYVVGENPLLSEPNLTHARASLANLDFLVMQGIFLNETAEVAHVVLPAASFAEKDGTFTNSERRVQLVRKAIDAPGDARPDWWISAEIARRVAARLGMSTEGYCWDHPAAIWDEVAALVPNYAGISHARLERGSLQWPCPDADHPGSSLLFQDTFPRGRGRFVLVDQGLPAAELPDEAYPLLLNTGRVLQHWHGGDISRPSGTLPALYPEVVLTIHPADAATAGVVDGESTRVSSRRGSIVARALLSDDVPRGSVFMPFVQLAGTAANLLTNDVYDPRSGIPEYKACAVRIEPIADLTS